MSTVARQIRDELVRSGISTQIVRLFDFYQPLRGNISKPRSRAGSLVEEENKEEVMREITAINEAIDFDDPKQIDFELIIVSEWKVVDVCNFVFPPWQKGLQSLKARKPFNIPVYDKFYKVRLEAETQVQPTDVIIVEGALIFCNEELRQSFDLSIYIDTDDDVRLSRRVLKNAQRESD